VISLEDKNLLLLHGSLIWSNPWLDFSVLVKRRVEDAILLLKQTRYQDPVRKFSPFSAALNHGYMYLHDVNMHLLRSHAKCFGAGEITSNPFIGKAGKAAS